MNRFAIPNRFGAASNYLPGRSPEVAEGEFLSPIALGRPERGMTDRRLLPKLRTGCSTFYSGYPVLILAICSTV
jgi:hypothetical protein